MSQHGSKTEANTISSPSSLTALVPIWDSGEQTLLLSQNRTFRAGRGSNSDLMIAHPGVAEWHATVTRDGDHVTVQPVNGQHVWINDQLVDQAAAVHVGDTLAIGPATFRIEARRAARRKPSGRSGTASEHLPNLSARLEKQLIELQDHYNGEVREANSPIPRSNVESHSDASAFPMGFTGNLNLPPYPEGVKSAGHATPFMDFAASTNRRSALDERETQLNEWHRSLDRRREELDKRSANLTRQQAALTARQTELDHRTAELELWHQVAMEDVEDRKASVNTDAEADLRQQRVELQKQEKQLLKEQEQLAEQLRRMEDSRQSIADQLQNLEDARRSLKEERSELAAERDRLQSETVARQQADSKQDEAFKQQQQQLDTFAQQLEDERHALQQQQASLQTEQERLESRNNEVNEAEQRIQLAAAASHTEDLTANAAQQAEEASATEAALQLLEEQKANLAEQQATIQQQLDAIQRKEGEFELLKADVEVQRQRLSDEQVALEFEKAEASDALEQAKRLQQELEVTKTNHDDDDLGLNDEAESSDIADSVSDKVQNSINEADAANSDALAVREQELAERTVELAKRLAELKSWKKQLEARELVNNQQAEKAVAAPKPVERPKSVIASQLSSLLMPPGMMSEADSLQDSPTNEELAVAQQRNADLQTETGELKDRVADLELQLQAAEQEFASLSSLITNGGPNSTGRALTEQNLLAELQALKSDLSDSANNDEDTTADKVVVQSQIAELEARNQTLVDAHQQEVSKYETTIEQLNDQLELVQKQFENLEERAMQAVAAASAAPTTEGDKSDSDAASQANAADNETVQKLSEMVEQLSEKLEQRNNTIDNLQAQLNGGIPVDSSVSMSPQEVKVLSQELDSRTVLLDEREATIRERERLLEQSEQELQAQRLALQEARQQLELARAEIHSAREPAASESMLLSRDLIDSVTELAEAGAHKERHEPFNDASPEEEAAADETQRSSVRSEIAELFGLGAKAKIEKPVEEPKKGPSTAAELMEAVDDYSQESAAAVSLSFESAQNMLMAPDSEPTQDNKFQAEDSEEPKDEADDVVASYMEQLLSRSRATADGGGSPEELKKTKPNQTVAGKPPEAKKPAGQASFIDKYMSGEYGSDKAPEPAAEVEVSDTTPAEDQLAKDESAELRRSKIDRNAQRLDLQSFRELSTQSAANALATHARRQQKGGITTRTTILTTLGLISVFVLAAAVIGVIPFGWLTTFSIIAVLVSGGELAWKMKQIQDEINERTRLAVIGEGVKVKSPIAGLGEAVSFTDDAIPELPIAETTPLPNQITGEASVISNTESTDTDAIPEAPSEPEAAAATDIPESVETLVNHDDMADSSLNATPVGEAAPAEAAAADKQPLEVNTDKDDLGLSQSTNDLLNSLELRTAEPTDQDVANEAAPVADDTAETSDQNDDAGVPDAFDEAFRMLTSSSLPIKKSETEDENN